MDIYPFYSSSSGNATKIVSGQTSILIEAGISYKKLAEANGGPLKLDAIFITHSHSDHINGAGIVARKTGAPLYMLKESYDSKQTLFDHCSVNYIKNSDEIVVGDLSVKVFDTRHDRASVGFIITEIKTGKRFGYLTDTGAIGKPIKTLLTDCDALLLETDYDEEELEKTAEYDDVLKERIRSPWGHLGTQQTLDYIKEHIDLEKVAFIILGHISTTTNSPEMVNARINKTIDIKYLTKFHLAPIVNGLKL